MAADSQLIIGKDGITFITPREFKVHAGQHQFKTGERISMPIFPLQQPICVECLLDAANRGLGIIRR